MISPEYECNVSLVDKWTSLHGNLNLAVELMNKVTRDCIGIMGLYEAQQLIKEYCINKYGIDYYEKNGEAINFIVENEYCHVERKRLPAFDMKRYIKDLRSGVLY